MVKKHDKVNLNNRNKTDNRSAKEVVSAAVASAISQLATRDNKSDKE